MRNCLLSEYSHDRECVGSFLAAGSDQECALLLVFEQFLGVGARAVLHEPRALVLVRDTVRQVTASLDQPATTTIAAAGLRRRLLQELLGVHATIL